MRRLALAAMLLLGVAGCAEQPPSHGRYSHHRPRDGYGPPRGGFARGGLFISPMGEPFRAGGELAPADAWFAGADANHDGRLSRAEMKADADRFFAALDVNKDGEIGPDEIDRYENEVAPEIRSGGAMVGGGRAGAAGGGRGRHGGAGGRGGGRGGYGGGGGRPGGGGRDQSSGSEGGAPTAGAAMRQGAARFSYLDIPEPVVSADADMNRGVSRAEFEEAADQRLMALDTNHDGMIDKAELPSLPARGWGGGRARPPRPDAAQP